MEFPDDWSCDHAFVEMLSSGVPGEMDLQVLIQDTEEMLRLNACSIEQKLKDLQQRFGETLGEEKVSDPTEGLECFSLGSLKRSSTDQHKLRDFFKALQHLLKTEEAREDTVLHLLLSISSQCGVTFPYPRPLSGQGHAPPPPVCSVRDDLALEVQDAWDDIRFLLQRHLLDKLQIAAAVAPPAESAEAPTMAWGEIILLLQQLFFLLPQKEVLAKYQALRSKAVLDLLRGYHTSAPGGERGFHGLAQGFQLASPAFCSMITEEIRVLNMIAMPAEIVAFLNGAYLDPVVRELGSLMKNEVELAMTEHGEKAKKSVSKKSSVAPQDAPGKGRSFLLTSHQLRGVTQLAIALLEMERSVEVLSSFNRAGVCSLREILKNAGDDVETTMLDGRSSPEQLLPETETVCLQFDWRVTFLQLVPQMVHCVEKVLDHVCSTTLQQEESTHTSSSHVVLLAHVPPQQGPHVACPERNTPKMVAKFCLDVMEEMDALLPLAVACNHGDLLRVRSCYVEVSGRVTSALLARLEERAKEVPSSASLRNLPALLASSTYLHQRMAHYESQLKGAGRVSLTLLPVKRSLEVAEAFHELLTSYCVHVCATSLLHDAESHHWADPKPFYEGERCSFSIQMWHYFICGLRSDLWESLAPVTAQDTLAQVLAQTLELLLQRYSRARPSYGRSPQIRADVAAILGCVHELMWGVCSSVEELLRPELASGTWVAFIHRMCDQLLGAMVILTAPLSDLHRTFQNGFGSSMEISAGGGPIWLHVMNPTLFPQEPLRAQGCGRPAALRLLRLVSSGPGWKTPLLLEATLHHDCLLPRTLIRQSHLCLDSEVEVSPEARQAAAEFVEAVFAVLSSLNSVPRALALAMEDYLDRRHLWDRFHSLADSADEAPPLFPCVRAALSRPADRLLGHVVNMIQGCEDLSAKRLRRDLRDLPQDILTKIPSEWKYTPQETKDTSKTSITLTTRAVSFIFCHLPSAVASIPLPIRYLFHVAEKRLPQRGQQLKHTGLLPRVLLACLAQGLKDERSLELASTHPMERGAKERLVLVSECLQVSVGQQKGVAKPIVQKVLQSLEERRPKWRSAQLQKACMLCSESMFERSEGGLSEEGCGLFELTEQKMGPTLLAQCQGTGGIQNLGRIRRAIQLNEGLLRSILTSTEDGTSPPHGPPPVLFSSSCAHSTPPRPFNPFSHFHHSGQAEFHQSNGSEREWDWALLLTSYQRMSQVTFTVVLANSALSCEMGGSALAPRAENRAGCSLVCRLQVERVGASMPLHPAVRPAVRPASLTCGSACPFVSRIAPWRDSMVFPWGRSIKSRRQTVLLPCSRPALVCPAVLSPAGPSGRV